MIPFDATKPEESNDLSKIHVIHVYCKECFQETSTLDFDKTYEEIGSGEVTFLMIHGGGGCRAMFRPHAEMLAKRGYRSVLLDLPGHGALRDTPLTLNSCVDTVEKVLQSCNLVKSSKTIYVGGSLGAYLGFYILDKLHDFFRGAVMIDCGQNVGPDCSFKARAGLWLMKSLASRMSNKALMNTMLGVTKKSDANFHLVDSCFGAGEFFDQGVAQVDCLHSVAPAKHIPSYRFPILFFNGSKDYRDSEDKWLSMCQDKERSELKVYEGGDHFFCHDSRFVDDLLDRIDSFAKKATSSD